MPFDYSKEPGKKLLNRYNVDYEQKPLISVITPYYNAGKYFEQTYNCVLNQTFPYFEWVIVNDGSSNAQDVELLESLAAKDRRIRVFHKENGGPAHTRNFACEQVQTEYIFNIDADDLLDTTTLECIYWSIIHNPEASFFYADSVAFQNQEYMWQKPFSSETMKKENLLTANNAMKKSAYFEVGCSDVELKYEDWGLWLKMLRKGMTPVHLSFIGTWYRRTDSGFFGSVKKSKTDKNEALNKIKEIASTIKQNVPAKEYPFMQRDGSFVLPKKSNWDKELSFTKRKTKVLMLLPWMVMGGADLFNLDVVSRMDKEKYEFSIITTVPSDYVWRQRFEEHVTDIFDITTFCDLDDFPEFISYFIKSRKIDILFLSNSYHGYYLLPFMRREFPDLAIVDYVHMEQMEWFNGGYARTSAAFADITEKTYVCNNHLRELMIDVFEKKPENIETVYIGVDTKYFNPANAEKSECRNEIGINLNKKVVLFPCRIADQKRPYLLVEIAKRACEKIPDLLFLVVGDGPDLEGITKKINKYGLKSNFFFAGKQMDMPKYYGAADVTLLCSVMEGLALTCYESLAMATPVISSDVGGQRELIGDDVGKLLPLIQSSADGWISTNYSEEEIMLYVTALTDIFSDKKRYETLCENCRNKIEKNFTKEIMVDVLDKEFMEIMNGRGKEKRNKVAKACEVLRFETSDISSLYCEWMYWEKGVNSNNGSYITQGSVNAKLGQAGALVNKLVYIATKTWYGKFAYKIFKKLSRNK